MVTLTVFAWIYGMLAVSFVPNDFPKFLLLLWFNIKFSFSVLIALFMS